MRFVCVLCRNVRARLLHFWVTIVGITWQDRESIFGSSPFAARCQLLLSGVA